MPRLQRWVLGVPCWPSRQRSKLEFGSIDGVLAEADGSTAGVVVAAGGLTAGAVVLGEVRGLIGGDLVVWIYLRVRGELSGY